MESEGGCAQPQKSLGNIVNHPATSIPLLSLSPLLHSRARLWRRVAFAWHYYSISGFRVLAVVGIMSVICSACQDGHQLLVTTETKQRA